MPTVRHRTRGRQGGGLTVGAPDRERRLLSVGRNATDDGKKIQMTWEMMSRVDRLLLTLALICSGSAGAYAQGQYPMLDRVAAAVVQKYQNSSCQQLAAERGQRPTGQRAAAQE